MAKHNIGDYSIEAGENGLETEAFSIDELKNEVDHYFEPGITSKEINDKIAEIGDGAVIGFGEGLFDLDEDTTREKNRPGCIIIENDDVTLRGMGRRTHLQRQEDANIILVDADQSTGEPDANNFTIRNMQLDCNRGAVTSANTHTSNAILTYGWHENFTVKNVWAHSSDEVVLHFDAPVDAHVHNCRVWNSGNDLIHCSTRTDSDGTDGPVRTTFNQMTLWDSGASGISFGNGPGIGGGVFNSTIRDCAQAGLSIKGLGVQASGNTTINCMTGLQLGAYIDEVGPTTHGQSEQIIVPSHYSRDCDRGLDVQSQIDPDVTCSINGGDGSIAAAIGGGRFGVENARLAVIVDGFVGEGITIRDDEPAVNGTLIPRIRNNDGTGLRATSPNLGSWTVKDGSIHTTSGQAVLLNDQVNEWRFERVTADGGFKDWSLDGDDHDLIEIEGALDDTNGVRYRWNGTIGGGPLGGIDLSATSGRAADDGVEALSDGSSGDADDTGGSRWTWWAATGEWRRADGGATITPA